MSDPLNMSLDDIIKKQKKTKKTQMTGSTQGKARTRTRTRRGGKILASVSTRGRVSQNFKGKQTNSPQKKNGSSPTRRYRGGGTRYFNATPRKGTNYDWKQTNPGAVGRNGRGRNRRGMPRSRPTVQQNQQVALLRNEFPFRQNFNRPIRRRGTTNNVPAFQSIGNYNWQSKLARKSVNRARQMLTRRKFLQNNRNRGEYLPTGRILVGKYGLVTTQRQNTRNRQIMMYQKIQRARQIREQRQQGNDPINRNRMQKQRRPRRRNTPEMWSAPFGQIKSRPGFRSSDDRVFVQDDWIPPLITVRNSDRAGRADQQRQVSSRPLSSGLDPNIQRKIQYIQEQGRRSRGDERQGHLSNRYLAEETEPAGFQPTIITSRMSLSDRFKGFMGAPRPLFKYEK